jgi:transposase
MVSNNCSVLPPILKAQILEFDRIIRAWCRTSDASRRLDDILGVGPMLATALVAGVADQKAFRSGRTSRPGSASSPSSTQVQPAQEKARAGELWARGDKQES